MSSLLAATHGSNVVLDQRQLSSRVPLVSSVFKVWVSNQRQQCEGSKNEPSQLPLQAVMAFQSGHVFCPKRAGNGQSNDPDPIKNQITDQSLPPR